MSEKVRERTHVLLLYVAWAYMQRYANEVSKKKERKDERKERKTGNPRLSGAFHVVLFRMVAEAWPFFGCCESEGLISDCQAADVDKVSRFFSPSSHLSLSACEGGDEEDTPTIHLFSH